MPTIYMRNFPARMYKKLKERAEHHRRSVTQEAAIILEEVLNDNDRAERAWEQIDRIRERVSKRYGTFSDSSAMIRKDRQR